MARSSSSEYSMSSYRFGCTNVFKSLNILRRIVSLKPDAVLKWFNRNQQLLWKYITAHRRILREFLTIFQECSPLLDDTQRWHCTKKLLERAHSQSDSCRCRQYLGLVYFVNAAKSLWSSEWLRKCNLKLFHPKKSYSNTWLIGLCWKYHSFFQSLQVFEYHFQKECSAPSDELTVLNIWLESMVYQNVENHLQCELHREWMWMRKNHTEFRQNDGKMYVHEAVVAVFDS